MRHTLFSLLAVAGMTLALAGCQTAPDTPEERESLSSNAEAALTEMKNIDAGLDNIIDDAHAYAIFPEVGKGGAIVGAAYGKGIVYQGGNMIGYSDVKQLNVGAQLGGQTYKEVLVFENEDALNRFKTGAIKFAADASAVAIKKGAAASANFQDGVAVFTHPNGGLMFEAAIGGQEVTVLSDDAVSD
jgi:lipid-binding SYLF domain-containing protein